MTPSDERHQVLRSVLANRGSVTPETEQFYAHALAVLSRTRRTLRNVALVANALIYGLWLCIGGFLAEQAWDRAQVPFSYNSAVADPRVVVAGEKLRVVVDIQRYRRCTYSITWSITDSAHTVHNSGPVIERAPGPPGHDSYAHPYETPKDMASGPATLRVTLRGDCDDNYFDNWVPRTVDMPPVQFEAIESSHDKAPPPVGDKANPT